MSYAQRHTQRQATQRGCLPSLLGDGDKGIEIVYGEVGSLGSSSRYKKLLSCLGCSGQPSTKYYFSYTVSICVPIAQQAGQASPSGRSTSPKHLYENIFLFQLVIFFCSQICSEFYFKIASSVADPGCLSRIPDPDFYPSRIPDPKTATKDRGDKNFLVKPFFVAKNFTKLNIILFLIC
jgi:hypothetical protein